MTEFTKNECLRLIDKLTETDPTTEAYHILLSSIERFDSIGNTVDEIAQLREAATEQVVIDVSAIKEQMKKRAEAASTPTPPPEDDGTHTIPPELVVPFEVADFPAEVKDVPPPVEEKKEEPTEEKTYESSEVRAALCDARNRGVNITTLLQKFGVTNFQWLPANQYGALMKELGAL